MCASAALNRWHTRPLRPALIEGRLRCGRVDAGITSYRVVFEDGFVQAQSYRMAYAVFGILAVTSSLVSIVYRIRHARHLRSELTKVGSSAALGEEDVIGSMLLKLRWELTMVSRDLRAKAVTLLGLALEDVPMVRERCAICHVFRASQPPTS